jgi:hypothetical protein
MERIKYPKDRAAFHKEYIKIFNNELTSYRGSETERATGLSLADILTQEFDQLADNLNILRRLTPPLRKKIKETFVYDNFQDRIAEFFMQHAAKMNMSTCYYCNLNLIYVYDAIGDYLHFQDFLDRAPFEELREVSGIGTATAKMIERARKPGKLTSLNRMNITPGKKEKLSQWKTTRKLNHFTLDHVISKSDFPLFSLSLYNLVPCCFVCNSKLKGTKPLVTNAESRILSPSSDSYTFFKDVRFRLLFRNGEFKNVLAEQDFALYYECKNRSKIYAESIGLFKLVQRYVAHKPEIVSLLSKRVKYSDTRLEQIASLLKIPFDKVKSDIFGEELFNDNAWFKPLTKLRRDIARDIGIPGVL